jgi:hypothetical protein
MFSAKDATRALFAFFLPVTMKGCPAGELGDALRNLENSGSAVRVLALADGS